jgi:hypothetical protein
LGEIMNEYLSESIRSGGKPEETGYENSEFSRAEWMGENIKR